MAVTADTSKLCPNCGDRVGAEAPLGLCPKCLLAQYLTPTDGVAPVPTDAVGTSVVPGSSSQECRTFGDYDLLEEIGRGGMGVVYRARQRGLDRIVALKMIIPSRLTSAKDLQRFRLEAETAAKLDQPNILPIYEVGEISGQPYFTTKYLEGGSLSRQIAERTTYDSARRSPNRGELPQKSTKNTKEGSRKCFFLRSLRSFVASPASSPSAETPIQETTDHSDDTDRLVRLFLKVCQAVAYAHARGVLHRDLKPANIILDRAGEPYVADFGLARLLEQESDLTLSHAMVGTPAYAAPEQLRAGSRHLTTAADVYSLGAVLYEMLAGRPPLRGPTTAETVRQVLDDDAKPLRALNPAVDRDLEAICRKCLEKDPRHRYANAGELAQEIEHYLAGEPIQARPLDTVALAWRWCRRRPAITGLIGTIAVAVLAVALVASVAAFRIARSRESEQREGYYNRIALANSLIEKGDIQRARELLLECPERYRHWEWGHLLFRCHQEILSIPAHSEIEVDSTVHYRLGSDRIRDLHFAANGAQLATLGADGWVKVWNPTDGRKLFATGGTNHPATAMAFSPAKGQLAIAFADRTLEAWDTATWKSSFTARCEGESARQLSWSADGSHLAMSSRREFAVWDAPSGELLGRRPTSQDVDSAWFTPDGKRWVVQTGSEARLYDPSGRDELGIIRAPAQAGVSLFVDPMGQRWVTIDSAGEVTLWQDPEHGMRLNTVHGTQAGEIRRAFFSHDGARFCTGGDAGTARVWDAASGTELFAIPSRVYQARFSPDGQVLATIGGRNTACLWDLEGKSELFTLQGHAQLIQTFAFSLDGQRLATAARDGMVKLWRTHRGREALPERSWLRAVSVSPDGQRIVTTPWGSREFTIWDAASGQRLLTVDTLVQIVNSSVFSPDGQYLVTAGHDKVGRVWDVRTGRLLFTLQGHTRYFGWVAWSPDGEWIATGSRDGTTRIWDAHTGRERQRLTCGTGWVLHVCFSPDGQRLASAGQDGLAVWAVPSGQRLLRVPTVDRVLEQVLFGPGQDRLTLAYVGEPALRICDARTGRILETWPLRGQAGFLSLNGDATRLAVPMYDEPVVGFDSGVSGVELWDADHSRRVVALEGHTEVVTQAWFTHADQRLVTRSYELALRQWEAFPWRSSAYPGAAKEPLLDRIQQYARSYWQQRLAAEETNIGLVRAQPTREALWPPRDSTASPDQIDLGGHYNALLGSWFDPFYSGVEADNDLSALPSGTVELGGVRFDIRGLIQLRKGGVERMGKPWQVAWERYPARVENIPIGRKIRRLHVLHGSADSGTDGRVIARWIWHYADAVSQALPGALTDSRPTTNAPLRVSLAPHRGRGTG